VVNYGVRNDFIIATDPSFPMIPFVNPFDGSANILGSLQDMADMSNAEQNILWSWKKTKKFAIANFDIYISRAAKESNVVSITDIDLNVKSRGSKLFLICVVCVACVAYVVCVGLKFFLVN
jgi:hypothetical protein